MQHLDWDRPAQIGSMPRHVADALEATEPGAAEKNIVEMTRRQRQIVFDDAKRQSLSVLYHLQNFVHAGQQHLCELDSLAGPMSWAV